MQNIQHPTSNTQHPTLPVREFIGCWMLDVGCWMFSTSSRSALETFRPTPRRQRRRRSAAFTLIEVMIAMFIFFVAVFTILGVVSNALRNARALQRKTVDAGMVAAQVSLTNALHEQLEEG